MPEQSTATPGSPSAADSLPTGENAARIVTSRTRRDRKTRRSVKIADTVAAIVIRAGGMAVVIAFASIVAFLLYVVIPLFSGPEIKQTLSQPILPPALDAATSQPVTAAADDAATFRPTTQATVVPLTGDIAEAPQPYAMSVDENLVSLWLLDGKGNLSTYRIDGAELIGSRSLSDVPVTATSNDDGATALGLEDGTVIIGTIGYSLEYVYDRPDALESLQAGQTAAYEGGVVEIGPTGALRVTRVDPQLSDPDAIGDDGVESPVRFIDYVSDRTVEAIVGLREDGKLFYDLIRKQRNMLSGEMQTRLVKYELPRSKTAPDELPKAVLMGGGGRQVYVVYANGHLTRYNTNVPDQAALVEEVNLLTREERDRGVFISTVDTLLGDVTLIVGTSEGGVSGWFAAPYPDDYDASAGAKNSDGEHMVRARELRPQEAAVTAVASSSRDRQFISGDEAGKIVLRHMTSGNTQATLALAAGKPVRLLDIAPKNNAILALDSERNLSVFHVDNPHPDGTLAALFGPVHYEGRATPEHFWQSSAGTDDAELKFGLFPLIFGTLKATVYAMVFAVPIAILGAIYSAEFMHRRVRAVVKPTIELMAGLPSVVLGFIAALVLAPFVETVVPAVLLTFAAVPIGLLLFGLIWQVMPPHLTGRLPNWLPFVILIFVVLASVGFAFLLSGALERVLFFGSFNGWADRRVGTGVWGAVTGWLLLLAFPCGALLLVIFNLYIRPRISLFDGRGHTRTKMAIAELLLVVAVIIASIALAVLLGLFLGGVIGWDLRGSLFGTYVQRNALNVGMVMGFAIIPIIYTVSEDALTSVPNHLRSAALGAGATPWQTAVRVVLPVAMSGIFSACMIGLGRAAGETMIVLMAAGNTPIIDWNLFSGLRTLSANIAVELPEAPVDGTHYRVLFLSAFVLFGITFIVNTAAEIVRLRFRRRAFQL